MIQFIRYAPEPVWAICISLHQRRCHDLSVVNVEQEFLKAGREITSESTGTENALGVEVFDTHRGNDVHWMRLEGVMKDRYGVVSLPGVQQMMARDSNP